jgi:hypothetical protein
MQNTQSPATALAVSLKHKVCIYGKQNGINKKRIVRERKSGRLM